MKKLWLFFLLFFCLSSPLLAQTPTSPKVTTATSQEADTQQNPSLIVKLAVLAGLALLPFAVMLLTSFMKIVVVLSLFRQALGAQQTPPNQVLTGIALLVTLYVMFPTGVAMYEAAKPAIEQAGPVPVISTQSAGFVVQVVNDSKEPLRNFLQRNCNTSHIDGFYKLGFQMFPEPFKSQLERNDFIILVPSFITSQLKSAFEIGVLIYLPFFVIDMVVSNILLAMGMMMLSPLTIALPIKLLLLVMIDGWTVLVQGLAMSFR